MAELVVNQAEADALIAMEKIRTDDEAYEYPGFGGKIIVPLVSRDRREDFMLDIERGRINLLKGKYQNRVRSAIILVRLDIGGRPHRNPDDAEIGCPHLHIYREGYGDRWAYPIASSEFPHIADIWLSLFDFMNFCHISEPPNINRGLFV